MSDTDSDLDGAPPAGMFPATRWTVVRNAGHAGGDQAARALAELCAQYHPPLLEYARHRCPEEEAKDLVQGFFEHILRKDFFSKPDKNRGRFRTFLLTSFEHHRMDVWDKSMAQKRCPNQPIVSIDEEPPEGQPKFEPSVKVTPETLFDRECARLIFDRSMEALKRECLGPDRFPLFEMLQSYLFEKPADGAYAELARKLGHSEGSLRVRLRRMRARFKKIFRDEVEQTVSSPDDLDDEIRHLIRALSA